MSDSLPKRWRLFDDLPYPIRRALDESDRNLMVEPVAQDWRRAEPRMTADDFAHLLRKAHS